MNVEASPWEDIAACINVSAIRRPTGGVDTYEKSFGGF